MTATLWVHVSPAAISPVAIGYGFNVTETRIGTKVVNVGSSGAAIIVLLQNLLSTSHDCRSDHQRRTCKPHSI